MNVLKRWHIALLILLPLLLTFAYLGSSGNFFLGALMCACLIVGCFCSVVFGKPEFGILSILVAVAFTDRQLEYMSYSFYLIYLAVAVCFIHYFAYHITKQKFFWFFFILICSYHILLLIVHPYTVPLLWTFSRLQQLAIFLLCILIKWDIKKIMNVVIPCLVYLLVYGFIEKLVANPTRIGGPTTHATNYAVILTFLWVIWFVYSYLNKKNLLILISVSFLTVFAVFLSGTRMGLLGLLAGFLGAIGSELWIKNLNKSLFQKIFYTLFAVLFVGLLVIGIWLFLPENLVLIKSWNILLSGKLDNSSLGRITCWATAIESFLKDPVWGIGPENFIIAHTEFLSRLSLISEHSLKPLGHAHSTGLNVLAENGLVGFTVLSIVFIICWAQLIKFLLNHPKNPLGYALFFGGIIIFFMPMIDMIPSPGWDAWYYGILASLGFHKLNSKSIDSDIPSPKREDDSSVKSISK